MWQTGTGATLKQPPRRFGVLHGPARAADSRRPDPHDAGRLDPWAKKPGSCFVPPPCPVCGSGPLHLQCAPCATPASTGPRAAGREARGHYSAGPVPHARADAAAGRCRLQQRTQRLSSASCGLAAARRTAQDRAGPGSAKRHQARCFLFSGPSGDSTSTVAL